jgi:hypothetical protein
MVAQCNSKTFYQARHQLPCSDDSYIKRVLTDLHNTTARYNQPASWKLGTIFPPLFSTHHEYVELHCLFRFGKGLDLENFKKNQQPGISIPVQ